MANFHTKNVTIYTNIIQQTWSPRWHQPETEWGHKIMVMKRKLLFCTGPHHRQVLEFGGVFLNGSREPWRWLWMKPQESFCPTFSLGSLILKWLPIVSRDFWDQIPMTCDLEFCTCSQDVCGTDVTHHSSALSKPWQRLCSPGPTILSLPQLTPLHKKLKAF